ncbi:MAG: hypothetical protein LBT89_12385 [Planctomycetaceae bacterium]|nr:hypothetical protein [Planctomycetaceae bacterium]
MSIIITSPSNTKIKEAVKLREAKHRRRTGTFLIDGRREIDRAIKSGIRILELFGSEDALAVYRCADASLHYISEALLQKIAYGDRNEGVVAVAQEPERTLKTFEKAVFGSPSKNGVLLAVLENIEKAGNVGAVFRSADAAGVDGIILAFHPAQDNVNADVFHPNTIRSSLGTVFQLPFAVMDSQAALDYLQERNVALALAKCPDSVNTRTVSYTDYDFRKPAAIVLGSEATGLTDVWNNGSTTAISLPMQGIADSLNISVAAGILFYEALRQRIN